MGGADGDAQAARERPRPIEVANDHAAVLQRVDNDEPGRSGLFWLPSYHDLGLIGYPR